MSVFEGDVLRLTDQSPALQLQVLAEGRERTLVLTGELDLAHADEPEATIRRLCAGEVDCLVIDLSRLQFIDSSGIRLVLVAADLCAKEGLEFRLVPGPQNVQRVFEVAGLDRLLPFCV